MCPERLTAIRTVWDAIPQAYFKSPLLITYVKIPLHLRKFTKSSFRS